MADTTLNNKKISPTKASIGNKKKCRRKKKQAPDSSVSDGIGNGLFPCADGIYVGECTYLGGARKKTSITPNAEGWAWFVDYCRKTGGSTCRWIDCWILGLRAGVKGMPVETLRKNPIVNVTVNPVRNIQRVRRRKTEYIDEGPIGNDEVLEKLVSGSPEKCAVCGRPSYARGTNKDETQIWLCRKHFRERKRSFVGWLPVKDFYARGKRERAHRAL